MFYNFAIVKYVSILRIFVGNMIELMSNKMTNNTF